MVDTTGFVDCTNPRPRACTQQYDPVCGRLQAGVTRTYSNACSACSDGKVNGYYPGACDE
jgi:hypothetical protein